MRVKTANSFVFFTGIVLVSISFVDFIKVYGVSSTTGLEEGFQHIIVFAVGVILMGLGALITLVCAIDAKLHE